MRQLCAFMDAIRVRKVTEDYNRLAFHAKLAGAEIKSLDEILGVGLDLDSTPLFDREKDEALTRYALKKQREMELNRGR
jgi:hypothetical protein